MSRNTDMKADTDAVLQEVLSTLQDLQKQHSALASTVESISGQLNVISSIQQTQQYRRSDRKAVQNTNGVAPSSQSPPSPQLNPEGERRRSTDRPSGSGSPSAPFRRSSLASKITLTTYPGQSGVDPIPLLWGSSDPVTRGPVVAGRNATTITRRNGEHGFMSLNHRTNDGKQLVHLEVHIKFTMH